MTRPRSTALAKRASSLPVKPEHEVVHETLLTARQSVETSFMDLAAAIDRACQIKVWEHYGAVAPDAYFIQQVDLRPRSWRRLRSIWQAISVLPEAEQAEAREAFAKLANHKASILVPLLRWRGRGATHPDPRRPGPAV